VECACGQPNLDDVQRLSDFFWPTSERQRLARAAARENGVPQSGPLSVTDIAHGMSDDIACSGGCRLNELTISECARAYINLEIANASSTRRRSPCLRQRQTCSFKKCILGLPINPATNLLVGLL